MTRNRSFARIAAVLLLTVLVALPTFAARGTADFTRFVAIGDSYGAGLESGSVNVNHQAFSWPAIIARQAGAPDFQQPLVSFPGIGPELQLVDVIKFPPTILPAAGTATPINIGLNRPYNNLSVPGANVTDVITLTGKEPATNTARSFAQFILRGLGTEVDQALAQKPTFIAVWIGGNDALGAVLAGTPAALTPLETFRTSYNSMLDKLVAGAPSAGIVVGNIPTAPILPYMDTVPAVLIDPATQKPVLQPNGQPIPFIADLGGGNIGPLPAGSLVLLPAASKIATGFGIPPTLKNIPPFNQLPDVGKPLADTDVLTPTELGVIQQRIIDFNTVITQAAQQRDIPVADIKVLFDRIGSGQFFAGPFNINANFITGGFFSLDGFHLTDMGYTLFADEYIRTINANYGTHIPIAPLSQFLVNNGITTSSGAPVFQGMSWEISEEAAQQILMFAPHVTRHRLVAH